MANLMSFGAYLRLAKQTQPNANAGYKCVDKEVTATTPRLWEYKTQRRRMAILKVDGFHAARYWQNLAALPFSTLAALPRARSTTGRHAMYPGVVAQRQGEKKEGKNKVTWRLKLRPNVVRHVGIDAAFYCETWHVRCIRETRFGMNHILCK
jgi:hypothetical protein